MNDSILLKGIKTHNLKNIDVDIPHGSFVVVTGVSGSGKSSLAFDTLYAEGRRRYVESLSTYSRQFLERIEKPDLEFVSGILPAIAIEAKNIITNARSTVGTQTELNDYLRLLFARIGVAYCTSCKKKVEANSPSSIHGKIAREFENQRITIAFPVSIGKKAYGYQEQILDEFEKQGFLAFLVNHSRLTLDQLRKEKGKNLDSFLVVADEVDLNVQNRGRILDSLETGLKLGKGLVSILSKKSELKFSSRFHCADCDIDYRPPEPNMFSFNSPLGACPECQGFGRVITLDQNLVIPNQQATLAEGAIEPWTKPSARWEFKQLKEFCKRKKIPMDVPFSKLKEEHRKWILEGSDDKNYSSVRDFFKYLEKKTYKMHIRIFLSKYRGFILCPKCKGNRLKAEALAVKIADQNIAELSGFTIQSLNDFFARIRLSEHDQNVADAVLLEIKNRISFLCEVGLGYLTLDRLSRTLSGGEAQRIHLAASLGSALVDTLYVLDEPSIGLHERDNSLLIKLLEKLKQLGNTVVVVEHDRAMIESADQVIDMGPLGGERGGQITFSGPFKKLISVANSYTAKYFREEFKIERDEKVKHDNRRGGFISVERAEEHNLKGISIQIPLNQFVVITGVSGSGKSTLMYDVLYGNYQRFRGRPVQDIGKVRRIEGFGQVNDLFLIDQSPIGRTPRSNPVTYMKAFDHIRKVFAGTRDAKLRGLTPSHFSFNVSGGRCEKCEGGGAVKVEMHFLADIFIMCEACGGSRYQSQVLEVQYHGKNIRNALELTIDEAMDFFKDEPKLKSSLSVLSQVGLGYLRLGQSATTLSGGEAQRLKLAFELSHAEGENLLYLFDEPTTGLHYYDITFLLTAFETLLSRGHSLCVIEHNMEMIKCADYVIDLGPEGGEAGGEIVYQGPLKGLLQEKRSHTGRALKAYLSHRK